MVVLSLSTVTPSLRGDISKWLLEIDTGVYVGQLNARVRDELWERICNNIGSGRVIMAYNAHNIQGFEVRTHNTSWTPIDFDGLTLMKHPLSTTKKIRKSIPRAKHKEKEHNEKKNDEDRLSDDLWESISQYVVIDLETTGLDFQNDDVIELAALRIREGRVADSFSRLISTGRELPKEIERLTGITQEMLCEGDKEDEVIIEFLKFIGNEVLISHNSIFDLNFIKKMCRKYAIEPPHNCVFDTLKLSRKKIHTIMNYRLVTIAEYFEIDISDAHRAESDARITMELFEKLKKMRDEDGDNH